MINPIDLLQLNYYELERISPETVAQASHRLMEKAGPEGIPYQGGFLPPEEARRAIALLDQPGQLAFFYELCRFPGLSRFLSGESTVEIEAEALQAEALAGPVSSAAAPVFHQRFLEALEDGTAEALNRLRALGEQLSRGSLVFQEAVFEKAATLLDAKNSALNTLAQSLENEITESNLQPLRGLQQFRQAYPAGVFNALPPFFDQGREQLARSMGRIVRALSERDTGLALAIARYARQFRMSEDYAGRLDKAIAFLQKKTAKAQAEATARSNRNWISIAGAAVLALLLLGFGLTLRSFYNNIVDFFYEPSLFSDSRELEEAGIEEEELALLREAMKDGKGLSREQLEQILRRPGNRTEVVENDVTQLPWRERGQAAEATLSGEVSLGAAPMAVCFPAKAPKGQTAQQLTIVGDKVYDALVFFFNGRTYVRQAFIPAQSKFELQGQFDDQQAISTMIIFGQQWDPTVQSPCGTPGYFTANIHYAGFAGYAMDPAYPDLRSDLVAYLKKQRLVSSRELEQDAFFDLLEKYR